MILNCPRTTILGRKEFMSKAEAYHKQSLQRVRDEPMPLGQKFPPGTRVRICDEFPETMSHFSGAGKNATVQYTYAHAYGGKDITSYSLLIDGIGSAAWYYEDQLMEIDPHK